MKQIKQEKKSVRKPDWLGRPLPPDPAFSRIRFLLDDGRLHTVCQEARCPNCGECFSRGTAAFLILGGSCTRRCRFCAVIREFPASLRSGKKFAGGEAGGQRFPMPPGCSAADSG